MKLKALVIDDSRMMRRMVMQTLSQAELGEFEFVEAEDGDDGLAKFSSARNIVFVDWNMPKLSGIEFVKEIRSSSKGDKVPLVMVTSEKSMAKVQEAVDRAGVDAYIYKPFTAQELHKKLEQMVANVTKAKSTSGGFFSRLLGGK